MKTAAAIIDAISGLITLYSLWLMFYRIPKAAKLRLKMSDLVHRYNLKKIDETASFDELLTLPKKCWVNYEKLPDFNKMVFSFKKLTLENYLSKELMDMLVYNDLSKVLKENKIITK